MLKSQETVPAVIKIYNSLDVCGGNDTRQCIISLGIGSVTRLDSLFGFNFIINYNPKKIKFNAGLTINTLADGFDEDKRYVTFHDSEGYIMGYAVTFGSIPVSGNLPLYAFAGKYVGDCPDTTYIRLADLGFTEEFKKQVDTSNIFLLVNSEAKAGTKSLKTGFDLDTLKDFPDDSIAEVNSKIITDNGLNLDTLHLEISVLNNEQHEIVSIEPFSDKVVIDSMGNSNNIFSLRIMFLDTIVDENILKIRIKQLEKRDSINEILIKPVLVNECGCIKNLISSKLFIKGIKQDSTHVDVNEENVKNTVAGYYNIENDEFIIKNSNKDINEIEIFDIQGRLIYMKEIENNYNNINIQAKYISQGIYFAIIKFINKENNKIVLIKN